jgi:hypothetical protein
MSEITALGVLAINGNSLKGSFLVEVNIRDLTKALERTAGRREDLLLMTSTLKREAPLGVVSGRSAFSR